MTALIAVDELVARLGDPGLRIVDVRAEPDNLAGGEAAHRAGRIPGAAWISPAALLDPDDPVPGQLASAERLAEALRLAGAGPGDELVAYDDATLFTAARLAWSAEVRGLGPVRVLDGGWPAWVAAGAPVEHGDPGAVAAARDARTPQVPQPHVRLERADVERLIDTSEAVVLDCRIDASWNDAGAHIPGARRFPAHDLLGDDKRIQTPEQVRAAAERVGATPADEVVLYCGRGVSATQALLALRAAGFANLAVYDGSWAEWAADPNLPREPH